MAKTVVIRIEYAVNDETRIIGRYIKNFDVNAFGGDGWLTTTDYEPHAMHFEDARSALDFYRQVSTVKPLREDGQPNRPLTAFTVTFKPSEEISGIPGSA